MPSIFSWLRLFPYGPVWLYVPTVKSSPDPPLSLWKADQLTCWSAPIHYPGHTGIFYAHHIVCYQLLWHQQIYLSNHCSGHVVDACSFFFGELIKLCCPYLALLWQVFPCFLVGFVRMGHDVKCCWLTANINIVCTYTSSLQICQNNSLCFAVISCSIQLFT